MQQKIVRKFTKRVYDNYSTITFRPSVDNLNPQNPSVLESQLEEMVQTVKERVLDAYQKAKIPAPEELFTSKGETPVSNIMQDLQDLMKAVKGTNNPLVGLLDMGLPDISPFLTLPDTSSSIMDNPLCLDCMGVENTLALPTYEVNITGGSTGSTGNDSGDSGDSKGDGSSGDSTDSTENSDGDPSDSSDSPPQDEPSYTITYHIEKGENDSANPETYKPSECPIEIEDAFPEDGYEFLGWYYDSSYNEAVSRSGIPNKEANIDLYAKIEEESEIDPEDPGDDAPGSISIDSTGNGDDTDGCDMIELTWLMIILIIILIMSIMLKVLVLVYNIMKAVADIAKDAQLCWINPPSLQSLISYVMQRLSAVIFQLIGMILLKIFAMLNLDCVADSINDMVDQINSVMASITSLMSEVDSTALMLSTGDGQEGFLNSLKALKDQLVDQAKKFQEEFDLQKMGDQISDLLSHQVESYKELFMNPELLYDKAIPPEIKEKVESLIDSYYSTQESIKNMTAAFTKMQKSGGEFFQGGSWKNVRTRLIGSWSD